MPTIRDLGINFIPDAMRPLQAGPPCDSPSGGHHESAECTPQCLGYSDQPDNGNDNDGKDDQGKGDKGKDDNQHGTLSAHAIAQLKQQMQGQITASF